MILSHYVGYDSAVVLPIRKKNKANIALTKEENENDIRFTYHFKAPSELLKYKSNDDEVYKEVIGLLTNEQKKMIIDEVFIGEVSK